MATAQNRRRSKPWSSFNTYTLYLLVPVVILLIINLVPLVFTFTSVFMNGCSIAKKYRNL